jgi:hypothetical protein
MDAAHASTTDGVFLAYYLVATGDLHRAIEHVGSVEQASSDDAGEYYAMAMASVKLALEVMESGFTVIRLKNTRADELLDLPFVAAADLIF